MPDRDRSTPYRPPSGQGSPQPEYPARVSDRPDSPRRSGPTTRQQASGSPTSPSGIACPVSPNTPSLPDIRTRRTSAEERPALRRTCSHLSKSSPAGSASSSQEGPVPYFQRYSSGPGASANEKKKKLRHLLSPAFPLPPFPGPMTRHILSSQPPANDGDRRPT